MRNRLIALAIVVGLLFLSRAYLSRAGDVPTGQPPLTSLSDLERFKAEFNRARDATRVLIILAPSCPFCLRGATEIQRILERAPQSALQLFVVWQPILPTDWGLPRTGPLHRLSDARVRQFWDADYHVAKAVEQSSAGRTLQPNCCFHNGVWWDMMAVYPPRVEWTDRLPEPLLLDGIVLDVAPAFETLLTGLTGLTGSVPR